jgi:hypothetical protein
VTQQLAVRHLPPVLSAEMARYEAALAEGGRYVPQADVSALALEWSAKLRAGLVRVRDDPRPCRAWLKRLEGTLPLAPGLDLAAVNASVILACAALPVALFTDRTLASALAKWRRFPVPADVLDHLEPMVWRLERPIRQLDILATRKPPAPVPAYDPGPATLTAPAPSWRDIQPPVRTVAEQIAALQNGG